MTDFRRCETIDGETRKNVALQPHRDSRFFQISCWSIFFYPVLWEFARIFRWLFFYLFFCCFLSSSRSPSTSHSWSMLCCPNVYSFQRYTTVALALLLESSRAHLFKHISQNTEQMYKHHQTSFINIKRKGKLQKKEVWSTHTQSESERKKETWNKRRRMCYRWSPGHSAPCYVWRQLTCLHFGCDQMNRSLHHSSPSQLLNMNRIYHLIRPHPFYWM